MNILTLGIYSLKEKHKRYEIKSGFHFNNIPENVSPNMLSYRKYLMNKYMGAIQFQIILYAFNCHYLQLYPIKYLRFNGAPKSNYCEKY